MEYRARLSKNEGGNWLVAFPDCPGCQTFGETKEEAIIAAQEALEGWLEAHLATGRIAPSPKAQRGTPIAVNSTLAIVLQLRWARAAQGLSQTAVAKRAGVSQQAIAKLEHPDGNPTLATLERVASALGLRLNVQLNAA
ncbi:MAG TPA: type II toxin-antitoxin system HicB family antitoxin [Polyangiaceae bacterium]|nr:type II toxin-antitoxin system HicB family antitoxin [Polyangiaceae bacterium]